MTDIEMFHVAREAYLAQKAAGGPTIPALAFLPWGATRLSTKPWDILTAPDWTTEQVVAEVQRAIHTYEDHTR